MRLWARDVAFLGIMHINIRLFIYSLCRRSKQTVPIRKNAEYRTYIKLELRNWNPSINQTNINQTPTLGIYVSDTILSNYRNREYSTALFTLYIVEKERLPTEAMKTKEMYICLFKNSQKNYQKAQSNNYLKKSLTECQQNYNYNQIF